MEVWEEWECKEQQFILAWKSACCMNLLAWYTPYDAIWVKSRQCWCSVDRVWRTNELSKLIRHDIGDIWVLNTCNVNHFAFNMYMGKFDAVGIVYMCVPEIWGHQILDLNLVWRSFKMLDHDPWQEILNNWQDGGLRARELGILTNHQSGRFLIMSEVVQW